MSRTRAETVGGVLCALILFVFVGHRLAMIFSAGDFLFALEPSEAKHTQIAWDLATGRYGTESFELAAYVANSGNVHHGSYFTCAMAYLAVSKVAGFGMLSVRLVPLLFWVAGFSLLCGTMLRRFGAAAAVLTALGLALVPTQILGLQVSMTGSHSEAVLPLTAALAAWAAWVAAGFAEGERRTQPTWLTALLGASLGYMVAFSYLLLPVAGLIVAITLLPPRPTLSLRTWGAGIGGVLAGFWPTWLIIWLEPRALFKNSITENPETMPLALAQGGGAGWPDVKETLLRNLPEGAFEYWVTQDTLPAFFGDQFFEDYSWRLAVLGPLLLLPLALLDKDAARRKLGTLLAVAPALSYVFLAFTTPWKPHIPVRYMVPLWVMAGAGTGLAVGLGLARKGWLGRLVALLFTLGFLWSAGPRAVEASKAVRPDRWSMNAEHRLVTYYNLGIHTTWAEDVAALNDFIDVRSASGEARAFGGVQAAMWGGGTTFGLGRGSWSPEEAMTWPGLATAIKEWRERQQFFTPEEKDDLRAVSKNIGWGLGIRTRWNPARVAQILDEAGADWPVDLPRELVWEGFGAGWGRMEPTRSSRAITLPLSIPEDSRDAVSRGMEAGRAIGDVPEAPIPPVFETVRGTAT
ncbi:MAG: hypothetical protein KDA24_17770 [Deltaproteobacteria bacterium]|nr:hypothetical protein [Deltaproteobacteria bacterium]